MQQYWWITSDNVVYVENLRNRITGSYYNSLETLTAQMYTSADEKLGDEITASYVTASNGCYTITIPDTLAMTAGSDYYLIVTIIAGGMKLTRTIYRTASMKGEQGD